MVVVFRGTARALVLGPRSVQSVSADTGTLSANSTTTASMTPPSTSSTSLPQTTSSPSPASSPSLSLASSSTPTAPKTASSTEELVSTGQGTVITLAVLASVFGFVVLTVVIHKLWKWNRRRRRIVSAEAGAIAPFIQERPASYRPVLVPPRPAEGTTWVPQIHPPPIALGGSVHTTSPAISLSSEKAPLNTHSGEGPSPPPSYYIANGPAPASPATPLPPPPAPAVTAGTAFGANTGAKLMPHKTKPGAPAVPLKPILKPKSVAQPYAIVATSTTKRSSPKSPQRTSSFMPRASTSATHNGLDGKPLPRLVQVQDTFMPSLDDELTIQIDETLRLLEEYQDGWCLVERSLGGEKGVIPRFCVKDAIPS